MIAILGLASPGSAKPICRSAQFFEKPRHLPLFLRAERLERGGGDVGGRLLGRLRDQAAALGQGDGAAAAVLRIGERDVASSEADSDRRGER